MAKHVATPERLVSFSDGVFAVLITVLVLDLHPPRSPTLAAFLEQWPTLLSYAVSYLFVAIVWVNHHHLLKHAEVVSGRLIWTNFAHLFAASFIPVTTAWMASSRIAGVPVAFYAGVFILVNITYILLCWELIDRADHPDVSMRERRAMRVRSYSTLGAFVVAGVAGLWIPLLGLGIVLACLIAYLRPGVRTGADGG